mmetsp:Transcript_71007/g.201224  ORF Transcript_71007/g.201224 Transcript_71007/m.201224 type:complete len:97 (-) Transcript_71007:727-1017(-)
MLYFLFASPGVVSGPLARLTAPVVRHNPPRAPEEFLCLDGAILFSTCSGPYECFPNFVVELPLLFVGWLEWRRPATGIRLRHSDAGLCLCCQGRLC